MYTVELNRSYFPAQANDCVIDSTLGSLLRERAALNPDGLVVTEAALENQSSAASGRSLTYNELLRDSERLATALLSRYAPGEKIAIWSPNNLEWVVLQFAAALAGLTVVTVNPSYQSRELEFVLVQSGAAGLFATTQYRGNPIWRIANQVASSLRSIREVVNLADETALFLGADASRPLPPVDTDAAALIIYTSGTTGIPKGAVLSHRGVTNNSRFMFSRLEAPHNVPSVTSSPLFHVAGILSLLGCMQIQSHLILLQKFDPEVVLDIVEESGAGVVIGVPTMVFALLEVQEKSPRRIPSLKRILCGGSVIAPDLVRRVFSILGCSVQTIYGQTECSGALTQTHVQDSLGDICETLGQALPMMEVAICDPGTNEVVPIGVAGEICGRGYGVMIEYNRNPEMTAAAIDREGWIHTGDLGTMDARGYVRITGRVKETIIRGGENIYPAEIENVLLEHHDVAEVAVVGVPDDRWGEVVAAFVRTVPGAGLNSVALVAHCRAQISAQKTPSIWKAVDSFPLTATGKIQKFALRDMLLDGSLDG